MALTNPWDKTKIGLILKRANREGGKRREEEEEEEEEKKRRREIKQKGMESNLDYGFYEIWYGSLVLHGYYFASNLGFVWISSIIKDVLKLGW